MNKICKFADSTEVSRTCNTVLLFNVITHKYVLKFVLSVKVSQL